MDDNVLKATVVVDASQVSAGMDQAAASVKAGTDAMKRSVDSVVPPFRNLSTTVTTEGVKITGSLIQHKAELIALEAAAKQAQASVANAYRGFGESAKQGSQFAIEAIKAQEDALVEASNAVKEAKEQMEQFGGITKEQMERGTHGAMMLGHELHLGLNKHLARLIGQSELLGPILSTAFSGIAVLGFIELLAKIPEMLDKLRDKMAGFGKEQERIFNRALADAVSLAEFSDQMDKAKAERAGAGKVGAPKLDAEVKGLEGYTTKLDEMKEKFEALKKAAEDVRRSISTTNEVFSDGKWIKVPAGQITPGGPEYADLVALQFEERKEVFKQQLDKFNVEMKAIADKNGQSYEPIEMSQLEGSSGTIDKAMQQVADEFHKLGKNAERAKETVKIEIGVKLTDEQKAAVQDKVDDATAASTVAKNHAEAEFKAAEAHAKRRLELGKITAEQEAAILEAAEARKFSIIQNGQQKILDAMKGDPETNKRKIPELEGRMQDESKTEKTDTYTRQTEARKVAVEERLRQYDLEIEKVKENEIEQDVILAKERTILQEELALGEFGAQKRDEITKRLEANLVAQEAEHRKSLDKQLKDEQKHTENLAKELDARQQKALSESQRQSDSSYSDQSHDINRATKESTGKNSKTDGFDDLAVYQAATSQLEAAQVRHEAESIQIATASADAKLAANKADQDALLQMESEHAAQGLKFTDEENRANAESLRHLQAESVAIKEDEQNKLTDIERKGVDERMKLEEAYADEVKRQQEKIEGTMLKSEQMMIFQSKNWKDAVAKLWRELVTTAIDAVLKIANKFITEHLLMGTFAKIFHTTATATQQAELAKQEAARVAALTRQTAALTAELAKEKAARAAASAAQTAEMAKHTAAQTAEYTKQTAAQAASLAAQSAAKKAALAADAVASKAGLAQETIIIKAADALMVHADAGLAFATAYAPLAWNPPLALSAGTAAAAATIAGGISAREGYDVPDVGPMGEVRSILHAKEMVLPADLAERVRSFTGDQDSLASSISDTVNATNTQNLKSVTDDHRLFSDASRSVESSTSQKETSIRDFANESTLNKANVSDASTASTANQSKLTDEAISTITNRVNSLKDESRIASEQNSKSASANISDRVSKSDQSTASKIAMESITDRISELNKSKDSQNSVRTTDKNTDRSTFTDRLKSLETARTSEQSLDKMTDVSTDKTTDKFVRRQDEKSARSSLLSSTIDNRVKNLINQTTANTASATKRASFEDRLRSITDAQTSASNTNDSSITSSSDNNIRNVTTSDTKSASHGAPGIAEAALPAISDRIREISRQDSLSTLQRNIVNDSTGQHDLGNLKLAEMGVPGQHAIPSIPSITLNHGPISQVHNQQLDAPESFRSGTSSGTTDVNGPRGGDIHYHAGDVHSLDGAGLSEVLKRNKSDVVKTLGKFAQSGHLNIAKLVGGRR